MFILTQNPLVWSFAVARFTAFLLSVGLCLGFAATKTSAQGSEALDALELTESGAAYQRAIRFSRIENDVVYFNPEGEAPDLEAGVEPPNENDNTAANRANGEAIPPIFGWIAAIVLAAVVYAFFRAGGGVSLSLSRDAENAATTGRRSSGLGDAGEAVPASLQAILAMSDRREAIVALTRRTLAEVMQSQGTLEQKSWTARDALRRLKLEPEQMGVMRNLVLASELVQFGLRPISEEQFQDYVASAKPFLRGAA